MRLLSRCPTTVFALASSLALSTSFAATLDTQVEELLSRMSLDEKVGQMVQVDIKAIKGREADIQKYCLGSALSGGSSDPATGNRPADWLAMVESL